METIKFKSGRVLRIENDTQAGWMLTYLGNDTSDERKVKNLMENYIVALKNDTTFAHLNPFYQKRKLEEKDYEILEKYFFEDLQKYGEKYIFSNIADFQLVMFCAQNGLSVPGGAVSW